MVQCASPSSAAALPRRRWSDGLARSSARVACSIVASMSPAISASAARYTATCAGRRANVVVRRTRSAAGPRTPSAGLARCSSSGFDAGDLTADHPSARPVDAQHRPVGEELVGEGGEPATQRGLLPGLEHGGRRQLDEPCRPLDVVAGHRVGDRLGAVAGRLVPGAGPSVELVDPLGLLVEQPRPEHVGEEVVVAVPEAAIVERDEEQVRPVEPLEHRLAAGPRR